MRLEVKSILGTLHSPNILISIGLKDIMSKRFIIGFVSGLLIFLAINLVAAHRLSDCGLPSVFGRNACADDITRAGWPLQFYEEGGFAYRREFNSSFLMINLGIGLGASVLAGWLLARRKNDPPK